MRHEIIALHNGISVGGAEFYPSCSQLKVGGSGTGAPASSELVSFPGAYTDDHPGIVVPDIYSGGDYTFPGPAVAKLAAGGAGNTPAKPVATSGAATPTVNNGGASSSPATTSPPAATATRAPASPTTSKSPTTGKTGKVCKVRKSRTASSSSTGAPVARRQHSRVMRRFVSSHSH